MSIRWLVQEKNRHQPATVKARRSDHKVIEMARALPRIIGDVDVTFRHGCEWEGIDKMPDGLSHRIYMSGRAGDRLGKHSTAKIKHASRKVPALADHR